MDSWASTYGDEGVLAPPPTEELLALKRTLSDSICHYPWVQPFSPLIARLIARSAFLKIGGMRS
jgi:hypothetical protein